MIANLMPIRQDIWYSVNGHSENRYCLLATHRQWRDLAMDAAEDYHGNHDGWESPWPLEFVLYESEDGPPIARFDVEREVVPHFYAWERPLSADAVREDTAVHESDHSRDKGIS